MEDEETAVPSESEESSGESYAEMEAAQKQIQELQRALDRKKKALDEVHGRLNSYEGIDPDEYAELKKAAEERALKEAEKRGEWDKLREQLVGKHQKELEQREAELKRMQTTVESYLIDAEASRAIASLKGVPDLLLPHVRDRVQVRLEDGKYVARVVDPASGELRLGGTDGQPMTIAQLVEEMRESEVFGRAFEGSGKSGSGAPQTNGSSRSTARKRGDMNPAEKAAFIAEHSLEEFKKLPA